MAVYELIKEERQPTCGGKSPIKSTILTVTTDDPVAYVRAQEPGNPLETWTTDDGTLVIETEHNGLWVRYEFTEDD